MEVNYALSQTILPAGNATTFDALVRFMAAPEAERPPRRPLNLSLVIDRSGSMAGRPLQQAIRAAQHLVDRLDPTDILSVVVYDDKIDTILPPQRLTDKIAVRGLLQNVRAGGTTNLAAGWLKGCEHVKANVSPDTVGRVLLLTDGQANEGLTDPQVLINTARQKATEGIITTTLGFGEGFNEDLLIGMAQAAGGNFYFIQSPDDAADVFRIEIDSLSKIAAQNLTVTLEPLTQSGITLDRIWNDYRTTPGPNGGLVVTLGDVYEGEDKLLAFPLGLAASATPGTLPILRLTYTYEAVEDRIIRTYSSPEPLTLQAQVGTVEEAMSASSSREVIEAISRIRIANAKEEAVRMIDQGRQPEAVQTLRGIVADLRQKGLQERFEIAEEMEQLEHFAQQIEGRRFNSNTRKEMRDQSYQGSLRNRLDLSARGIAGGSAQSLPTVATADGGVELECYREGGKLRMRVVSDGYDHNMNVQFPRHIREEGIHYVADEVTPSADGTFYRASGQIKRLQRPGDPDPYANRPSRSSGGVAAPARVSARSAADLETTDSVGTGVLVQCVREGGKLRARVVSDGYNPNFNMRFPRDIREEGILYVVDQVSEPAGGGQYMALGKIRRLIQ